MKSTKNIPVTKLNCPGIEVIELSLFVNDSPKVAVLTAKVKMPG